MSPRPFVCPDGRLRNGLAEWEASEDNSWWSPSGEFYPSASLLLPGDVLLFAPRKPDRVQLEIQRAQRRWGAEDEHAQFTHAALYVGLDHLICEATRDGGVMYSFLDRNSRLNKYCWIARRWPGLTLSQRQRIPTMASREFLGKPYNWRSALSEWLKRGSGASWESAPRGLVCSRLCDRAIVQAVVEMALDPAAGWKYLGMGFR